MILLLSILFTIAITIGLTIATQYGSVLFFLRWKAEAKSFGIKAKSYNDYSYKKENAIDRGSINEDKPTIYDALILCLFCMPSIWSAVGYFFAFMYVGYFDLKALLFYPITVGASSFLGGFLWKLNLKLNS